MSAFVTGFKNIVLDHILGGADYQRPQYINIALLKSEPGNLDTPQNLNKADYTGYADLQVLNNQENFPQAVNGIKYLGKEIHFPEATGGTCTVTHLAFYDSVNNVIIAKGMLNTQRTFTAGLMPRIMPGDVSLTLL